MATVISKTYARADISEMINDLTNAYSWEKVETTEDGKTKFYVDTNKYIQINLPISDSGDIIAHHGTSYKKIISVSGTNSVIARFVTCKSGLLLQFNTSNLTYTIPPTAIVGTATNKITGQSEKAIFVMNATTSSGYEGYVLSNDNASEISSISSQVYPKVTLNSKITTALKISALHSESVMDNALYIFQNELPALSNSPVTFGGKNYYMMSAFMLED